jgi:hypothetical protein
MRCFAIAAVMAINLFGMDAVKFFNMSPTNELLCKVTQYSYKIVSQKNAELSTMHGHEFFRLKSENLYILKTGCHALDGKKEAIVF